MARINWLILCSGGPAGLVYGYLVAWLGSLSVFIVMGELTSMFPIVSDTLSKCIIFAQKLTYTRLVGNITGQV